LTLKQTLDDILHTVWQITMKCDVVRHFFISSYHWQGARRQQRRILMHYGAARLLLNFISEKSGQ